MTGLDRVRSPLGLACWDVLNRRRGYGFTVTTVISLIEATHPGLLQGNQRTKYKLVHQALSRIAEVNRRKGKFWLDRWSDT